MSNKKPRSITVYIKKIILFTSQTSSVPDSTYCPSAVLHSNSEGFKASKVQYILWYDRQLSFKLQIVCHCFSLEWLTWYQGTSEIKWHWALVDSHPHEIQVSTVWHRMQKSKPESSLAAGTVGLKAAMWLIYSAKVATNKELFFLLSHT